MGTKGKARAYLNLGDRNRLGAELEFLVEGVHRVYQEVRTAVGKRHGPKQTLKVCEPLALKAKSAALDIGQMLPIDYDRELS